MGLLFRDGATWNSTLTQHIYTNYLLLSIEHTRRTYPILRMWSMSFIDLWHHTSLFQLLEVLLSLFDRKAEVGMVVLHTGK